MTSEKYSSVTNEKNSNKPVKAGLLSFGMSGKLFHAPFVATSDHFEFVAVVERSKKVAQQFYPNVISYNSVDELLANPEIELVIVNTPNNTHFDFTKQAIEAGKDVLVEKPFVPTANEARALFDLARKLGRKILVYQNRRWNSDFYSVRDIIESNRIGELVEMHIRFDRFRLQIGPKAFKETPLPGSGIGYDLGSHIIDQVISLFGKPEKALKIGTKNRPLTQVEDYVCFVLSYGKGPQIYITTSYMAAESSTAYVLHGTRGSFRKERSDVQENQLNEGMSPLHPDFGRESDADEGVLTYHDSSGEMLTENIPGRRSNFSDLFDLVYQNIRNNQPYPITEDQVIAQLEILEQPFWN